MICLAIGPTKYRLRAIALFAGTHIYKDRTPTTEYERKCDQLATELLVHVILSVMLDLVSYFFIVIGPAYVFIASNKVVVPAGVIVPFMDPSSPISLIVNFALQFTSAFIGFVDTIGLEITNCFVMNSYRAMADLVCLNMRTFSDGLQPGRFTFRQKMELRNIIVQLNDLEAYLNDLNDLYYWRTLSLPVMATWCVALGIFTQMNVS